MTYSVVFIFGLACYLVGLGTAFLMSLPIKWGVWLCVYSFETRQENTRLRKQIERLQMENDHLSLMYANRKK